MTHRHPSFPRLSTAVELREFSLFVGKFRRPLKYAASGVAVASLFYGEQWDAAGMGSSQCVFANHSSVLVREVEVKLQQDESSYILKRKLLFE